MQGIRQRRTEFIPFIPLGWVFQQRSIASASTGRYFVRSQPVNAGFRAGIDSALGTE
jgi:hypothetical protein